MNNISLLWLGGIGTGEMVILLIIILVIFGAGKLPQIGESLGKGIKNFKTAVSSKDEQTKQLNSQVEQEKPIDKKESEKEETK